MLSSLTTTALWCLASPDISLQQSTGFQAATGEHNLLGHNYETASM